MGKGSWKRQCQIPHWLYAIRYDLAHGNITQEEYNEELKKHEGEDVEPKRK
ncbi:hypothetical protein LCGC14_0487070 [marine sediment metagenome]|uniref:Uncharacterized protein n=1 Tax=marine sediment metagenome TaxID=412755 RepID=A0A0F9VGG4_9ZZZZ